MTTARRSDTLRDQNSVPIPGALLSVIDYAGNAAVLKNDDASDLANPFETDAFGGYVYNTTPGRYTERFTYGGRTVADDRDVVVGTIIAAVDPSPANAGKFVALDASGIPIFASGTGADSALRTDLAGVNGASLVRLNGISDQELHATYTSANPKAYGMRIDSASVSHQVDSFNAGASFQGASAAGYGFHAVVTVDASVPAGAAGAVGGAIGGVGTGSAVVGNLRDALTGNGVIGTAADSSSGAGVLGTFNSLGTGSGVIALKQNTNGTPGGPHGTGPALTATNSSEQGSSIESYTESNNGSLVSNVFERRNTLSGIIHRLAILLGGARTGTLTGGEVLIQPATALTGTGAVNGYNVSISASVTGSAAAAGINVSNAATGGTNAYGVVGVVTGTNGTNYGARLSATGGTLNYALYCAAGDVFFNDQIQAPNLPVYADNTAASAVLAVGKFYRTATGQVMVRY